MPNTIAELRETVAEYEQRVTNYAEAGEIDKAHEATGALAAYREMLLNETQRVEEENARLAEQMQGLSNPSRHTVGELALGARDAFDGIAPGWKAKVALAMATVVNTLPPCQLQPMKTTIFKVWYVRLWDFWILSHVAPPMVTKSISCRQF